MSLNPFILVVACAVASLSTSAVYYRLALRYGPLALPNFRSLHQKPVPRGGGLAIALPVLLAAGAIHAFEGGSASFAMIHLVGGSVIMLLGVADDRWDLSARIRFPCQIAAAGWIVFWLGANEFFASRVPDVPVVFSVPLLVFILVWFYNAYNFIDGIDGMASTATIFIGGTMAWVLQQHGQPYLALVCALLAAGSVGFLAFNWPPARMFMGEAGSSFISYIFSAVCLESIRTEPELVWHWLLVGTFYLTDTTLTTLTRALTVPSWYRPHRSHAYQNLARIWGDHRRVLMLVLACNIFWLLPVLWLVQGWPQFAPLVTIVAYLPVAAFCTKYGPRFENK